jgi:hypothetical protein
MANSYKIDDEKICDYVRLVTYENKSKIEAYCTIYDLDYLSMSKEDKKKYSVYLYRFENIPAVRKSITDFQTSLAIKYSSERMQCIDELYNLAFSAKSEKVRVDAIWKFLEVTKPDKPVASSSGIDDGARLLNDVKAVFNSMGRACVAS